MSSITTARGPGNPGENMELVAGLGEIEHGVYVIVLGSFLAAVCNAVLFSAVAAFIGTWVGKYLIERISETLFRSVFRLLVTVSALRMLYMALSRGIGN